MHGGRVIVRVGARVMPGVMVRVRKLWESASSPTNPRPVSQTSAGSFS